MFTHNYIFDIEICSTGRNEKLELQLFRLITECKGDSVSCVSGFRNRSNAPRASNRRESSKRIAKLRCEPLIIVKPHIINALVAKADTSVRLIEKCSINFSVKKLTDNFFVSFGIILNIQTKQEFVKTTIHNTKIDFDELTASSYF